MKDDKVRIIWIIAVIIQLSALMYPMALADGFSTNPEQINDAAKSVMMLEVYDHNNNLIKTGSGFVAFDNKHLITNYHVADGADMIYAYSDVGDPYIIMDVCISDNKRDIAILQFFSPTDLHPLDLNESGDVLRASPVVAIGSPKGFSNTISTGIVSSLYEEDDISYVQFTAPISSGSSGGALFDDNGKVIGITSASYDDGHGINQNLNFAVNIKEAIDLYTIWNGEKMKLSAIGEVDISTPEPTYTPVPTPAPTSTHASTPTPSPTEESTVVPDNPDLRASKYLITITKCSHYFLKDDINLKFKIENHTDKKIKEIMIDVVFWEKSGKRYSMVYNHGGRITIKKTISPGEFEMSNWVKFKYSSRTVYLTATISSVKYTDGTTEKKKEILGEIKYDIN